jgi:ubiquitin conjugation factor E4 B
LVPHLLLDAGEDKGICPDFLAEAVSRFEEDESVKTLLAKSVAGLSAQLSQLTMKDNYQPYVTVSELNVQPYILIDHF